jgi:outer membrane protein insertion porin family
MSISEEIAGGVLGGDNSFSKLEFDGRWFFPVLENSSAPIVGDSVFAFHVGAGYVAPLHDGDRIPLFERYFPGGILSLRGFNIRSLGPVIQVASSNDPTGFSTTDFTVGGNKELIVNAEYIFPIIKAANIKGVFFFDMGNAFDNGETMFTLAGQRYSTGFGLRWFSPIGPLRFAWGFPLDRKEDESLMVFDFTIGSLF